MPQLKEALVSLPSLAAKKLMYYLISPLSPRVLWGHRPAPSLPAPPDWKMDGDREDRDHLEI